MTVAELMTILENCNPDAQVEMMYQRNYPLISTITAVTTNVDIENVLDEDGNTISDGNDICGDETTVYLLEGSGLGYGNSAAWDAECR